MMAMEQMLKRATTYVIGSLTGRLERSLRSCLWRPYYSGWIMMNSLMSVKCSSRTPWNATNHINKHSGGWRCIKLIPQEERSYITRKQVVRFRIYFPRSNAIYRLIRLIWIQMRTRLVYGFNRWDWEV